MAKPCPKASSTSNPNAPAAYFTIKESPGATILASPMALNKGSEYAITANPNTWNMGKTHKKTRCILPDTQLGEELNKGRDLADPRFGGPQAGILFGKREVVMTRRIAGGFGNMR
ncbi:hypothetical protein CCACVL1_18814 [Corchorus capsularis]|uniref:Uncharacterized protein n=1 Tax=Corchorus capsularis TaxID=210143 RepID=A0A1R3HJU5_COCAP|nr:hypothetical protein CCACVL1_18814 [Corchorus capsularis]